jgi:hypothetical protein
MGSLPTDNPEFDELTDENIPTVEIPDFDPDELDEMDTLFKGHPLIELLTPESKVRIILALLRVPDGKFRPTDIYDRARISHNTWHKYKDTLVNKYGVIEQVGKVGNSPLYQINDDNEVVDHIDAIIGAAGDRKREYIEQERDE